MNIDNNEKERRKKIVEQVIANFRLEGLELENYSIDLYNKWINGEISLEEMDNIAYEIWK